MRPTCNVRKTNFFAHYSNFLATCGILFLWPCYAVAQLEEITVTATKQEESLQDVPIAITVFGEADIEGFRMQELWDITSRVPAFQFSQFNRTQTVPAIRGAVSFDDSPGTDQPVAMFIDGVYTGNLSVWDLDIFDIERIEVLRGPQGVTFGRNVVGGAISLTTRKPSEQLLATVSGSYDNMDAAIVRGSVSGPLFGSDSVFGGLALGSRQGGSYAKNTFTGQDVEDEDKQTARASLRWLPSDAVEVVVTADYSKDESFGHARVFEGDQPVLPEFVAAGFTVDPDIRNVQNDAVGGVDREFWSTSAQIVADFDLGTFYSITAYSEEDTLLLPDDIDGTSFNNFHEVNDYQAEQFTQEFRLHSPADEKFEWLAGLYYFDNDILRNRCTCPLNLISFGLPPITSVRTQDIGTESWAVFGDLSFHLSDQWDLSVGARYTSEEKSGRNAQDADPLIPGQFVVAVFDTPVRAEFDAFTPRIALEYRPTDEVMIYGTASRGFTSGGFSSDLPQPSDPDPNVTAATPLKEEYANAYTVGTKSRWAEGRFQANIEVFFTDFEDLQFTQFVSFVGGTQALVGNTDADISGIDIELSAFLTENLNAWFNYTYQDGHYDSNTDLPIAGNRLPLTPRNGYSTGFVYDHQLSQGAILEFRGNVAWKEKHPHEPDNELDIGGDTMVDAALSFMTADGQWKFSLWGKNLLDEDALKNINDFSDFLWYAPDDPRSPMGTARDYHRPLTVGASVTWNFEGR